MADSSNLGTPFLEPHPKARRGCLARPYRYVRDLCISLPASFRRFCGSVRTSFTSFFVTIWTSVKKEPAKTIHAFKMGLALSLAFLLVLLKVPYAIVGSHAIWAIMTVVVVFEFSIGATLSKGYNRGAGTLAAGLLAVALGQLARSCGHVAYPIVVGLSIFLVGTKVFSFLSMLPCCSRAAWPYGILIFLYLRRVFSLFLPDKGMSAFDLCFFLLFMPNEDMSAFDLYLEHYQWMISSVAHEIGGVVTFARLWPSWKTYEFGFRTFLITFSLIMVAEYRQGDPLDTAVNRFLIILMGATIGLSVNLFVLPLWAGEELHDSLVKNFESVADSLEVCVNEYLKGTVLERVPSKIFMGLAADDPVYKGYRSALVSASKEESLASFAVWEPPHGRFKKLRYPWLQYQKVGAVLRHCTYSVVALHGCLRSAIQAPLPVRLLFETELREVSVEGAQVLRKLGKQVQNMHKGDPAQILNGVRHAVERLQQSLYLNSYLLIKQESRLDDDIPDDLSVSVLPEFKKYEQHEQHNGFFRAGSFHKMGIAYSHDDLVEARRRCFKKLNSWPSRPIDDFDFAKDSMLEQRVRVLESASALSLGTFATLLMEVALRLDYVVEAVDELSDLAHFKLPEDDAKSVHSKMNGNKHSENMVETGQENC